MNPPRMLTLAAVAVSILIAGCGGSGASTHTNADRTATSPTSTAVTHSGPLASGQFALAGAEDGQETVEVSVFALRRVGPFLDLYFTYDCTRAPTACDATFNSAFVNGPEGDGFGGVDQADGVSLVDPVDGRVYLPVRVGGQTYASTAPPPAGGATYLAWVRFPAPPPSVARLDVAMPFGDYLPNVPVGAGQIPALRSGLEANQDNITGRTAADVSSAGATAPVSPLTLEVANPGETDNESGNQTTVALSSDVLFAFAKATLSPRARSILQRVAAQVTARAEGTVHVTGYTDSIGSSAVNIPLSVHRAEAVVRALQALAPHTQFTAAGKGAADPVAPNQLNGHDYPAGRAQNRRVTIQFTARSQVAPSVPPHPNSLPQPTPQTDGTMNFVEGLTTPGEPPNSRYRAENISLVRQGSLLLLRMTLTCTEKQGCNTQYGLGSGPGTLPPNTFYTAQPFSTGGFYLEDPSAGTYYLVARDAYGNPVASSMKAMDAGQSMSMWALFPAPPMNVTQMTLLAPPDRLFTQSALRPTGAATIPLTDNPSTSTASGTTTAGSSSSPAADNGVTVTTSTLTAPQG